MTRQYIDRWYAVVVWEELERAWIVDTITPRQVKARASQEQIEMNYPNARVQIVDDHDLNELRNKVASLSMFIPTS